MSATSQYISAIVHIGKRCIDETTKRLICHDGFSMSVQASERHYASPHSNKGPWEFFEVGFPTKEHALLLPYMEVGATNPLKCVYPYVPADIVEKVLSLHGGFHTYYSVEHPILGAFSIEEIAAAAKCEIKTASTPDYAVRELLVPLAEGKSLYFRQGSSPRDREIELLYESPEENPNQLQLALSV